MRPNKILILITCILLSVLQIFLLCSCNGVGAPAATGAEREEDSVENPDALPKTADECIVGTKTFQSAEVAQYVNAVYSHAVYYGYNIFETFSDTLYDWLKSGGSISYGLYAVDGGSLISSNDKLLLIDIDGDELPKECGMEGLYIYQLLVLRENGIQSAKQNGVFCKKDELGQTGYFGMKAGACYLGAYEITYKGRPDDFYYEKPSDELCSNIKSALQNGFSRDSGTYANMPSGKYTVSIAPAFASDRDAYVYFRNENGGVPFGALCCYYKYMGEADTIKISAVTFLDDASNPYCLGNAEQRIADSPCTFEIEKP